MENGIAQACGNHTSITRAASNIYLVDQFDSGRGVKELGVKVRFIPCNIGPAERSVLRNMDRARGWLIG